MVGPSQTLPTARSGRLPRLEFEAWTRLRNRGRFIPLLERVKKAREVYRLSSQGEYDIVTSANLTELAKLLAALDAFADQ